MDYELMGGDAAYTRSSRKPASAAMKPFLPPRRAVRLEAMADIGHAGAGTGIIADLK